MTAKLVGEEGLLKDLVLSLEEGDQWIIGRDPDACQLLVEDPSASRKHALCRKTPQGIIIESLTPNNPVIVNDEPVTEPKLLQHNDTVKIGDTLFRFYTELGAQLFEDKIPEEASEVTPQEKTHDTIFEDEPTDERALAQVNFDLMDTGRWLLKVVGGPNNGAEFPMQTGQSYVIGTDPNSCDIVFYDTSVSRQHARITIGQDDVITITDLKSRNGTRIDGEILKDSRPLAPNTMVTVGTTSFVVYDREGEMQTIISPLLPSLVKVLQKEPVQEALQHLASPEGAGGQPHAVTPEPIKEAPVAPSKTAAASGAFIVIGILVGLFVVIGFGLSTLFMQEPVVVEQVFDPDKSLTETFGNYPGVKYSFNKASGRLLLVGHVLTATDRSQLIYTLKAFPFIKDIDDSGVIIDEYVWKESNQVLSENPNWKGVTIYASAPGHFLLSGYLHNRAQAEQVWDYLTRNFPYVDLLENKIVVEEDIVAAASSALRNKGFSAVTAQMNTGELTLKGTYPTGKQAAYTETVAQLKELPGVRSVNNLATEAAQGEDMINVSSKYVVSGISKLDNNWNVVINGRILAVGDILDGMKITSIEPHMILLEKDGIKYRIDF